MAPYLRETQEGVEVALLVQPRASRTRVVGEHDGRLKVALAAPPVDGAANDALIEFLADCLKVGRRALRLAHGDASRRKTVVVAGAKASEIQQALEAAC
ncbi:MAG: DUF167 domain-containing protein [Deltaproteobacteria bacterium]|nr:DUF167 domain-containing protein [Deltaproteobacteria bacterium]